MKEYLKYMKQRADTLRKAIDRAEMESGGTFPEGRLRISVTESQVRYYHVVGSGNSSGVYITTEKSDLARALAQKDYNIRFLNAAGNELAKLERAIKQLSEADADLTYQKLTPERQKLITPYILTDDLYASKWQAAAFKSNSYMPEAKIYDTRKGEKVRSKSEAILADIFYELGIPYHYEKPVLLKERIIRYPDFTLLKKTTRDEIYLEHFGLMDDDEYRDNCFRKLDEYRINGIYPGKNLIMTFESSQNPLDIKGIRMMIKDIFCS